jgi:FHA domain
LIERFPGQAPGQVWPLCCPLPWSGQSPGLPSVLALVCLSWYNQYFLRVFMYSHWHKPLVVSAGLNFPGYALSVSSRTPEGELNRCPVCGETVRLEPSRPPGDAPCPSCGRLLWFPASAVTSCEPNGKLVPVGGVDSIPLVRHHLTIGRRESCDICLHFPSVSLLHCELDFKEGCWTIRDLNSINGVKINGVRVKVRILQPGDTVSIAKRKYTIEYNRPVG